MIETRLPHEIHGGARAPNFQSSHHYNSAADFFGSSVVESMIIYVTTDTLQVFEVKGQRSHGKCP